MCGNLIDLLPGTETFHCHPYRARHRQRAMVEAKVDEMLRKKVIERKNPHWTHRCIRIQERWNSIILGKLP